jgi:hypothetical protein
MGRRGSRRESQELFPRDALSEITIERIIMRLRSPGGLPERGLFVYIAEGVRLPSARRIGTAACPAMRKAVRRRRSVL